MLIIDGICTLILAVAILCILVRHIQHEEKRREEQQTDPYKFLLISTKRKNRNRINGRPK